MAHDPPHPPPAPPPPLLLLFLFLHLHLLFLLVFTLNLKPERESRVGPCATERLKGKGFAAFAEVVEGADTLDRWYAGYGEMDGWGCPLSHL
jgi:hypothetical protein